MDGDFESGASKFPKNKHNIVFHTDHFLKWA